MIKDQGNSSVRNRDAMEAMLSKMTHSGLLTHSDSAHVFEIADSTGAALDQILCRLGMTTETALAQFYAGIAGATRCDMQDGEFDRDLVSHVNLRFCEARRVLPLRRDGDAVYAAIVDPMDRIAMSGLEFALNSRIKPQIATASEFERLFVTFAENSETEEDAGADLEEVGDDAAKLKDLASAEPAVRLVNRLISDAARARASDIHVEPKERETQVRMRIDGVLAQTETLLRAQGLSAVSRLKILANLDIAERRRPQDGRLSFPVGGKPIDMRISTTPTIHGESVVIRLLEKPAASLSLDALGFSPSQGAALKRLISRPNGILLITGPTGSGKTTTLYALLEIIARRDLKILTIEDPVEYQIDDVSQTQVNPAIGLNFASAMRSFLRHDPDVIMVGEMRDLETARTAVQAALTGHLVLSTLHTNDAPSALARLLDMGLEDYLVGSTLLGVAAQRLVRRVCGNCVNEPRLQESCKWCHGNGYMGRLAISEILEIDDSLRSRLRAGATASELKLAAAEGGFVSMQDDGAAKIRAGLTTPSELKRVLGSGGDAN